MKRTYLDYHQDGGINTGTSAPKHGLPAEAPSAQVAPWLSDGPPALKTYDLNFPNNGAGKPPKSPSSSPHIGQDSEYPDPLFHNDCQRPSNERQISDDRRPSVVSETTVSSQNSVSKASTTIGSANKKLHGIFGGEGRQSSRSSETSIPSALTREHTNSSQQGSIHSTYNDGRPLSPGSSRPRTPLPSSEVTPWLFQDFKVRNHLLFKCLFDTTC